MDINNDDDDKEKNRIAVAADHQNNISRLGLAGTMIGRSMDLATSELLGCALFFPPKHNPQLLSPIDTSTPIKKPVAITQRVPPKST